jgi:hypothetical protein
MREWNLPSCDVLMQHDPALCTNGSANAEVSAENRKQAAHQKMIA